MKSAIIAGSFMLAASASAASFPSFYVFGDSLSDAGNIAAIVGSNPAQVVSGNSYIPSAPYGSDTFSNGPVWVSSFATGLGLTPSGGASLLGGGNFAFGGARASTDGLGLPPSANTQVGMFLGANGGVALSDALYIVEIGGNDARDALQAAAISGDPFGVIATAAETYASDVGDIVDSLQAAGAINIIVWNTPNLGLAPAVQSQGAGAAFLGGAVSSQFNSELSVRLLSEVGVSTFDVFGLMGSVVASPSTYALTNVNDACGAVLGCNAQNYLFWDGIHPTARGHEILSGALLSQVNQMGQVPEPATWGLMILGIAVVGYQMRRKSGSYLVNV